MSNTNTSPASDFDRKSARFIRACIAIWLTLCPTVYWLSGFDFARSPALGWLLAVTLVGLPVVLILAGTIIAMAKDRVLKGKR